jgi:hypothetical protein
MPRSWKLSVRGASLSLLVISIGLAIASPGAAEIQTCKVPAGVTATTQMSATPPALARALKDHIGVLAAPGAQFDTTDIIVTGVSHRLIFVWSIGQRWVVATEQGGIFYSDRFYAYDLSKDGQSATLVQERMSIPDELCSTASSLLSPNPGTP